MHYFFQGHRILGYAIAVYDYAATSTTQVSLKQNDRIAIISKNGSDKGWWKGQNLRTNKVIWENGRKDVEKLADSFNISLGQGNLTVKVNLSFCESTGLS